MTEGKVESGTIILNQKGAEIGVIKKVYSNKLARLELQNSESIAMNPNHVGEIQTTGRILKKKQATITSEAELFFKGASERVDEVIANTVAIIVKHLATKETRRALQYFEFDIINDAEIETKLPLQEAIGFIRGIELASKTPQDFIIKSVFKVCEENPALQEKAAPEIVVDKLNQEKAFTRVIWNLVRVAIAQAVKLKELAMIDACSDVITEIGLKKLNIEYRKASNNDILYWQKRVEDCILKYIGLMILSLDPAEQPKYFVEKKNQLKETIKDYKIASLLREQAIKMFEDFDLKKYDRMKPLELIHAGIKGFNLEVMTEKRVTKNLLNLINDFLDNDYSDKKSVVVLQKRFDEFVRETRDVSKPFMNILFEMNQFLKKIEYGDSKIRNYYSEIMRKTNNKRYSGLGAAIRKISKTFLEIK
jgi:hypothetical protein